MYLFKSFYLLNKSKINRKNMLWREAYRMLDKNKVQVLEIYTSKERSLPYPTEKERKGRHRNLLTDSHKSDNG